MSNEQEELDEARKRLHSANADRYFFVEKSGDRLAKEHGYRGLFGDEAARYYLMQKHGWLPREVMSMSFEELAFALSQEARGAPSK